MPGNRSANDFKVGERAYFAKTISETDIVMFAGISGDFAPIHMNAEFAKETKYGERIAHGALTASLISSTISRLVQDLKSPGAASLYYETKFVAPVRIGDTITAVVELVEIIEEKNLWILQTACRNQRGEDVVVGKARLKVL